MMESESEMMELELDMMLRCVETGGKSNNSFLKDYCDCGSNSYNPDTHKCNDGKVEKL